MHKNRSAWTLTLLILLGLILGGVVGQILYSRYAGEVPQGIVAGFEFIGQTFFMSLLKMILVPLVACSVMVGVASIGEPRRLGWVGSLTLLYYFVTMASAVTLGVLLVTAVRPGEGISDAFRDAQVTAFEATAGTERERIQQASGTGLWGAFQNIVTQVLPGNPLQAAVEGQILPVISFSLLLGIVLTAIGPQGRPVLEVVESLLAAIMKLVEWILWLAPVGVFALMAWTVSRIGLEALGGPLFYYVVVVLTGLLIHAAVVLPLFLLIFGRANPARFAWNMREALLTAFATDSSSATLPVTIDSAEQFGGCSRRAARFVLPLGATINMDGTALYEAVAVIFLFQAFDIPLGTTELIIIVLTATLAAVGAAGIPSAGLVTMVIVVEAVNNSLGGDKHLPLSAVGIILGIDRLLDMCRTTVNVWGDAVGAKIITRIAPDEVY